MEATAEVSTEASSQPDTTCNGDVPAARCLQPCQPFNTIASELHVCILCCMPPTHQPRVHIHIRGWWWQCKDLPHSASVLCRLALGAILKEAASASCPPLASSSAGRFTPRLPLSASSPSLFLLSFMACSASTISLLLLTTGAVSAAALEAGLAAFGVLLSGSCETSIVA